MSILSDDLSPAAAAELADFERRSGRARRQKSHRPARVITTLFPVTAEEQAAVIKSATSKNAVDLLPMLGIEVAS